MARRGYGLGQRDPQTLPGKHVSNESTHDNRVKSRTWRSIGKTVRKTGLPGFKYV